jgi:Phage gp6-like head-tail connector protein
MPRYGLTQTVPPVSEPLSLTDVKDFLRVTDTDQDRRLYGMIAGARARFEKQTGRQLVTATWLLSMDWFWDVGATYVPGGPFVTGYIRNDEWRAWQERGGWGPLGLGLIRLPRNPLLAITQVQYVDLLGVLQTADPSLYQVDITREVGRLAPAYGQVWPSTRAQLDAVQITFQAGYGPVTTVTAAVAAGAQTVTPASMAGISVGQLLTVDPDTPVAEKVTVTAATSTTFTATFANAHTGGWTINNIAPDERDCLLRCVGAMYEMRDRDLDKLDDMLLRLIETHASKTYA